MTGRAPCVILREERVAKDVPRLAAALGGGSDLLAALQAKFRGPRADRIRAFLDEHKIPCQVWSRTGD